MQLTQQLNSAMMIFELPTELEEGKTLRDLCILSSLGALEADWFAITGAEDV